MKRIKLFAGIELPATARKKCEAIAQRLRASGLDARYEAPEKLHITVAFLGWADPEQVEAIRGALLRAAESAEQFEMTLDKLGAFPHERRPRVVWLGTRALNQTFQNFARMVRAACAELGFMFDKDAVPHVTLARVKGGEAHLPVLDVAPVYVAVRDLTLFESLADGRTTHYEIRARFPLKLDA